MIVLFDVWQQAKSCARVSAQKCMMNLLFSGGFRGGAHPARARPTVQNFLDFMQFFRKFDKIVCWRPPRGLAPPPTGNPGSAPAIIGIKTE